MATQHMTQNTPPTTGDAAPPLPESAGEPRAEITLDMQTGGDDEHVQRILELEQELKSTREYLQATIEELETANEELKSTNEELQSSNEELQSTNKELQTSKEELQSVNEELVTVNAELQSKVEKCVDDGVLTFSDVSRLKESEDALCESKELYRAMFHDSLAIQSIIDQQTGQFVEVNQAACDFYGYSRDELTTMTVYDLNQMPREHAKKKFEQIRRKEKSSFNFQHRLASGEIREVEVYSCPVVIHDKQVIHSIVHDVTERKQAEETIRFQAYLLNCVEQAMIATNLEGRVLYLNHFAETLYGWAAEEAIGRNIMEVTVPQITAEQGQKILSTLMKGDSWQGEFLVKRKDESTFLAYVIDSPVLDEMENMVGIVGISFDMTDRRQAEETLRQSNQMVNALIDYAPIGIQIFDRNGFSMRMNEAHRKFLGLPSVTFGVGEFNVLTDPFVKTSRQDEFVRRAYAGETIMNEEFELDFGVPDNTWQTHHATVFTEQTFFPLKDAAGRVEAVVILLQDITERKRAERSLQHNETQFNALLKNSRDLLYCRDLRRDTYEYVSATVKPMLGYTPEEFATLGSETVFNMIHPDDRAAAQHFVEKTMTIQAGDQSTLNLTYRLQDTDGHYHWLSDNVAIVHDADGRPIYRIGNVRDISGQKEHEQTLRTLNSRLQQAQQLARLGYWDWLIESGELRWSPEVFTIFGQDPETFVPTAERFEACIHPEDLDAFIAERAAALEERRDISIEHRIFLPDGEIRTVHEIALILRDEDGNVIQVTGAVQDVTRQKQAEQDVIRMNRLLESVIKQAPFAIHILDGDINHIHVIIENDESKRIMGEQVEGRENIDADHSESLVSRFFTIDGTQEIPFVLMPSPRAFQGEIVTNEEFLFRHPDGTDILVAASASPVYVQSGEIIAVVVVFHDITERKRTEMKIQQSLHEKEVMLQEIHHRVKNNLQIVSSLLDFQADYTQNDEVARILRDSRRRVQTMALLHSQLYQSESLAQIDMAAYFETVADEIAALYKSGAAHIVITIDVNDIFFEVARAIPCGLLLNELLSNVMKYAFSGEGKDVEGEQNEVRVALSVNAEGRYTLTVSDNGVGLPPDFHYPSEKTLGMFLIETFAEQLHGTVEWNSNGGTSCIVRFKHKQ